MIDAAEMADLDLDLTEQQLLQEALSRRALPLDAGERRAEVLAGGAFVLVAIALWVLFDVRDGWNVPAAVGCAIGIAAAMRVRFDVAGIYTVPSQLAFIPLLFAVPAQAVPLVVVLALAASRLPELVRGEVPPSRLLLSIANGWFAVGPAVVLLFAGGAPVVAGSPLLIVVLFAAQVGGDFAASSLREALVRRAPLREQLSDARWVYSVDAALTPVAFLGAATIAGSPWRPLALGPLLALLGFFARERKARLDGVFALNRAYRGMAFVLGDVVEADDQYTGEHCKDVLTLALTAGERLGLDADRMRNLEFGALLHDVGKIAVPKEIINKPGKLTDDEFEIVKTHTIEGQRMLDRVGGFMRDVGVIVRHHHERWDGRGYPDALSGDDIPLEARIVACCDTFNAITTTRPYRQAGSVATALAELRRCSGTQFDPVVVEAVAQAVGDVVSVGTAAPAQGRRVSGHDRARPATPLVG
jgi:putative nucleotidyltransferase with HDIG domain